MTQETGQGKTAATALPEMHGRLAERGLRFAVARGVDSSTAEELVQEAFCRLLPRAERVDPTHFTGLFFVTLRNLVVDGMRTKAKERLTSLEEASEVVAAASEPTEAAPLELRLREIMKTLPERHAEALELKVNGELSYDQISEVLGCTHGQVRTWIHRARQQLRRALARPTTATQPEVPLTLPRLRSMGGMP